MQIFTRYYQATIEKIAPLINQISKSVPKRRERVQHIGLFGYSRGVGEVKLPRAITFTSSLYSIGVPPELIGTGRGLRALSASNMQDKKDLLEKYYINIRSDLLHTLSYTNFNNLEKLAKHTTGFDEVLEDAREIASFLGGIPPLDEEHLSHQAITSEVLKGIEDGKDVSTLIEKAALVRRSIG